MSVVSIDTILGNIGEKYDITDHVAGRQHDPNDMSTTNFKQEYTVVIRKKKYYAATTGKGNYDQYVKMYQINEFGSVSLNNSVNGVSPGTCRVSLVGGTKIVCATRVEQDKNDWGSGETGFFNMLSGWAQNLDDNTTKMEPNGNYIYNNMLFDNIDDMKKIKYGWKVAEKCDIEPMDEIYVYGKSRKVKDGDKYKIYQLFFGYISEVTKSYAAGKTMPIIQISAVDQLKILQISYIANTPALNYNVAFAGAHYNTDSLGNLIIDDNPLPGASNTTSPEIRASFFTNVFAGKYPYEIVTRCAKDAGIPDMYLLKRIEPVKRIPFLPKLKDNIYDIFQSDTVPRLGFCNEAAKQLCMEFFADEEGNLVFKIPNYTLGVNKRTANNAYIDGLLTSTEKTAMERVGVYYEDVKTTATTYETVTTTLSSSVTHKVVKGDTLWSISKKYLGNAELWPQIYAANSDKVPNAHWIYPGQIITIKKGKTTTKQVPKTVTTITKKKMNGGILSSITDKYIPAIMDNEIISFVLTDSDSQVINGFEISQELGQFAPDSPSAGTKLLTTRVIQDWGSIMRFGIRPAKVVSTPLLNDKIGAELFGTMMVQKSLSQRYKGTLCIIEESSIRVGNPIRVFMYDEHPYKFGLDQAPYGQQQAVFYVESIGRDIKSDGVSTMTLTLSAGRVMGMESIYDKMQLLYKDFYTEESVIKFDQPFFDANNATGFASAGGFDAILRNNMKGHGAEIIAAASKYNIDASIMASIIMSETGGNIQSDNNPGGIMDWDKNWSVKRRFATLSEGIDYMAKNLYNRYFSKGITTVAAIGAIYAPIGAANDPGGLNKEWIPNVNSFKAKFDKAVIAESSVTTSDPGGIRSQIIAYGKSFLGTPYVLGGKSPTSGFDCSGFVAYVFGHYGYKLTSYTHSMVNEVKPISKSKMQMGDILFFRTDGDGPNGHVGIYMGNNQMIHTGNAKSNLCIVSLSGYYEERISTIGTVF
jgi:cell wall-associated NlpC family hydrolase/LysM repeat protein